MPSSFSRFLDETELKKVRELYLESLAALDAEDEAPATEAPATEAPAAEAPAAEAAAERQNIESS